LWTSQPAFCGHHQRFYGHSCPSLVLTLSFPVSDFVFSWPDQKQVTSLAASPFFFHAKWSCMQSRRLSASAASLLAILKQESLEAFPYSLEVFPLRLHLSLLFWNFFFYSLFFLKDITAPRQRGLARRVTSRKGLKQKREFFA